MATEQPPDWEPQMDVSAPVSAFVVEEEGVSNREGGPNPLVSYLPNTGKEATWESVNVGWARFLLQWFRFGLRICRQTSHPERLV